MQPLIDADVLLHEIGWSGEFRDKDTGENVLLPAEHVMEILDKKIEIICEDVMADEEPILYISDSEWLAEREGRKFIPNFRYEVAKTQPYKGNRKNPKPFHFYNIMAYMLGMYNTVISTDGLEADDMMSIEQFGRDDTIICSRDKDLRICPGWHYSWECGKQNAIMPTLTDSIGWLEMTEKVVGETKTGKPKIKKEVKGYGLSFFYYQMLVGDSADHIPGLSGVGVVGAYNMLCDFEDEQQLFECVRDEYKDVMGKESKDYFLEQANLLWIMQEKGKPYEIPRFE